MSVSPEPACCMLRSERVANYFQTSQEVPALTAGESPESARTEQEGTEI